MFSEKDRYWLNNNSNEYNSQLCNEEASPHFVVSELGLFCILGKGCSTVSFLPSKENTKYYSQGTKPLPKIIIFILNRCPKNEGIRAERGKEEKQRGKRGMERPKGTGNWTRCWHQVSLAPFRIQEQSEDMCPVLWVWPWWMNGMWPGVRFCAVERILPKIKAHICLQLCPFKLEHHCFKRFFLWAVVGTRACCQTWLVTTEATECCWRWQENPLN